MDSTVISRFFNSPRGEKGQVALPEKELRYLRTIIVIADIDEGLDQSACASLRSPLNPTNVLIITNRTNRIVLVDS